MEHKELIDSVNEQKEKQGPSEPTLKVHDATNHIKKHPIAKIEPIKMPVDQVKQHDQKSHNQEYSNSKASNEGIGTKINSFISIFWNPKAKGIRNPFTISFIIILLSAIYLRLKYFSMESIWNDASVHLWWAQKVLQEPLFFFSSRYIFGDYFLLQPFMSIFYLITGDIFIAAKIVAVLFSIIGIVAIYLLASEIRNKTVGLVSAIILSVHHLLWFYNVRVLADAPLVSMFILSFYLLTMLEKRRTIFYGILSAISIILTILVKKQAIIFPVALFIYFIIRYRTEMFKDRSLLVCWGISFATPMLLALVLIPILGRNLLYSLFIDKLVLHEGIGSSLSVIGQLPWIYGWYIIAGLILGLLIVLFYKLKYFYLPITITLIYALWFEIGIGIPYDRYLLPIIPIAVVLTALTIDEIGSFAKLIIKNNWIKFIIIIPLIFMIVSPLYADGINLIDDKSYSYIGYQDAADWLEVNAPEEAILYAGSPRSMRAFTGKEYLSESGQDDPTGLIINLRDERFLDNQTLFEEEIIEYAAEGHDIYLEIDIWEYTQASWYFPLSDDSINYFISLGFNPVEVIYKDLTYIGGMENSTVIFLFKYSPN